MPLPSQHLNQCPRRNPIPERNPKSPKRPASQMPILRSYFPNKFTPTSTCLLSHIGKIQQTFLQPFSFQKEFQKKCDRASKSESRKRMGACTSTAAGSSSAETCDNVYRIRQLDEKYRRKQLFILRLTDKQIIIMRKGRREKPEKTISVN